MEIVSYKKTGKNLYEIRLDNGEKYKLFEDIIIENELLIDKNLTESKLKKLLSSNELLEAYYKSLKYIGVKMRTEKEITMYLKKLNLSSKAIDFSIKKLKRDGYINEEIYAQAYINDAINLSNNGPRKIINNLINLGISDVIIFKYFNYNDEFWKERIFNIVSKNSKRNKDSAILFKNKMYKSLLTLGYECTDINAVLDDFKLDTSDAFNNDARKLLKRIEKESDREKKIWSFRSKMYAKGYSQDEINEYIKKELI